jgi:cysteine-rich repeat protein
MSSQRRIIGSVTAATALALVFALALGGCPGEPVRYTGVRVVVRFDPLVLLEDLEVTGAADGVHLFGPTVLAHPDGDLLAPAEESFVVLLDPALDGAELRVQVIGRIAGSTRLAGQGTVQVVADEVVTLTVLLSELTGACGDGVVDVIERCDDGNLDPGDGCDGCVVEAGWSCTEEPSVCDLLCGDGTCDIGVGESGASCPADCGWRVLAVGLDFVCGLKNDQTAWCWGEGHEGQLGTGSTADSFTPAPVSGVTDAVELGAGLAHACVLTSGGQVWCWGTNLDGQLGTGTPGGTSSVPVPVSVVSDGQHLAVGANHTCVVRSDTSLWCWGLNSQGRLGDGTVNASAAPVPVTGHSGVTAVALHDHSCAMVTGGNLYCWGANADGQLGLGFTGPSQLTPQLVSAAGSTAAVTLGVRFTCVLTTAQDARCWGDNEFGQLGDGTVLDRLAPVVVGFPGTPEALAAGGRHVCGIRSSDGTVWGWGNNAAGALGDGTLGGIRTTPVQAVGLTGATAVSARRATCAVLDDGSAWCWGDGSHGELGTGMVGNSAVPVAVVDPY